MIEFQQVSKSYGGQDILRDVSFRIGPREHVGIVGPNGAGKTSVFELIVGNLSPDKGTITIPQDSRLGYVRQHVGGSEAGVSLLAHAQTGMPALDRMHHRIESMESELRDAADEKERTSLLGRIGHLQTQYEAMGGYDLKLRAETVLGGLGFAEATFARPLKELSGGWQMRAELARVLAAEPDILLLDEPSNYLDIPAVEWLQRYLREFRGALALISHDRYLLTSLTSVTIEIANGHADRYPGNYSFYIRERSTRCEQLLGARKNQDRERAKMQRFIDRYRADKRRASLVQSSIRKLEKMEQVEVPAFIVSPGRIRLRPPTRSGHEVARLEHAGITYDDSHWVLRDIDLRVERGEKTAIVGLNGMGKTTLLRALAGRLPLSEGERVVGHKVVMGYQSQESAETMDPHRTVYDIVKSAGPDVTDNEARTLLGGFGFSGSAVDKHVSVLSGGEKIRLAFARLLVDPPNFLILDEPTTHLDVQAREALEQALSEFEGTVYLVSHDIEFVRKVATSIIQMRPPGIMRYPGDYDYFREKTELESVKRPKVESSKPAATGRRADRQQRAKEVQALARERRSFERRMAKAERAIETLEAERSSLIEALSTQTPDTDYASTNRRLTEIQKEIDVFTRDWEFAAGNAELLRPQTSSS